MDVIVDGVPYVRADSVSHNKIGIAITTHNRPQVLANSLEQHRKHLPAGAVVFVIDDGSNPPAKVPDWCKLIRHDKSLGIVASKNASLECLMDSGCEHLFLWDDDAYAIADNWHLPYIESPEPHLAYQFKDLAGPKKLNDMAELYRDDQHVAYTGQRGVMLYFHRSAIEKVGGFDPVYGRGMYEHPDLALRIHNAGLTTWAFADVVGSEKLIYSLDEHEAVERSVPRSDREALARSNAKIFGDRRDAGYTGYVEYRRQRDVVITSLLTNQPDPQRGVRMSADPEVLSTWSSSIRGADAVVLADELTNPPANATLVTVPALEMSVYFARWLHIYQYLRNHQEIRFVWCTDGTDVEMLREPWDEMQPGVIYVGSEPKTYDDVWMKQSHHGQVYATFLNDHSNNTLLNAGLVGGSRDDVMEFAHRIIRLYYRIESHLFWGTEKAPQTKVDMCAFGIVAKSFGDRIVTGPKIHTVFKTDGVGREYAFWKHK